MIGYSNDRTVLKNIPRFFHRIAMMSSWLRSGWLLVFSVGLVGCGSNMPETIDIEGRVTIDGAAPPAGGIVYFLPVEAAPGFPTRPGTGDFGPDGVLSVTTFEQGDGLMPGKYQITVECWDAEPVMGGPPSKSYLARKYQNATTSGLTVDVASGAGSQTLDLPLTSK
jgi:hypothetical protein